MSSGFPFGDRGRPRHSEKKSRDGSRSGEGNWRKRAIPPEPSEDGRMRAKDTDDRFSLGRSSGLMAAGAWSARLEVMNLLEARCDPGNLIRLIKSGKEGSRALMPDGSIEVGKDEKAKSESFEDSPVLTPTSPASEKDRRPEDDIMKQKAILESLADFPGGVPPWQKPRKREQGTSPAHSSSSTGVAAIEAGFAKRAKRPPPSFEGVQTQQSEVEVVPQNAVEEPEPVFPKKATPPSDEQRANAGVPSKASPSGGRLSTAGYVTQDGKEKLGLEMFHRSTLGIFKILKDRGVVMDIVDITEGPDGVMDLERFRVHTAPNKASTGNRYARLMQGFLKWESGAYNQFVDREEPFERLNCLSYMELLSQKEVGARTLQAFLYSVDFYAKALGFTVGGGHFQRAKRMALRYSQMNRTDRKGAPMFTRATMIALEKITCDPLVQVAQRVAAGKLRLCIQASIRHDDLANTPLSSCEWVRRRGDIHIVGLRGKARRGKSGARAWVASVLAVDVDSKEWLPILMQLLLEAHGAGWKADDHCGKTPNARGDAFTFRPASLESDVMTVKACLTAKKRRNVEVGLDQDQIDTLRWHGAKATLTSVMQHLKISSKVVRFSGDWHDSKENMADTYLREAMVMVLRGQERALAYLRSGGDLGGLVGEPLVRPPPSDNTSEVDLARCDAAMVDQYLGKFPGPAEMLSDFLDKVFNDTLPDLEKIEAEEKLDLEESEVMSAVGDASSDTESVFAGEDTEEIVRAERAGEKKSVDEVQTEEDASDTEGMIESFVQVKFPTTISKLHRPVVDSSERDPNATPAPVCGAKGTYTFVSASESFNSGFCIRCFGRPSGCGHICEHTAPCAGDAVKRCTRRCAEEGQHGKHLCHMHSD